MTRGPTFWIVVLAILGATGGLWVEHRRLHPPPPPGVTVADIGDPAPEASFVTVEGKARQLSDWRGKRVLINYWASWCGPCRQEMPLLDAAYARYRDRNIVVLGLAEDTATGVRGYLARQTVSYPIMLVDADAPGGSLSLGNTRRVLPYSVLIGEDGRILRRKVGTFTGPELDEWLAPAR